ncbi:cyclic AMP-dependent transcription factor ATF-2-like [Arapaima gigas]
MSETATPVCPQKGLAPLPPALCPASLHIPSVLLASPDTDTATSPSRTTVPVSSSFPLLLQLPSGQTMPVALSASVANVPAGLPLSRPIAMVPGVPGPTSPQPVQSEAKMVSSGEPGDAPSPASPEELVMQSFQQPATSTTETAGLPSPPVRRTPSSGGRRRRAASEDPDEKRRRFLERNRAAASRCRQKRKVWVQALEKKAEDLDSLNSQLQIEVVKLRTEVVQLKQLLLAHQDCPVTAVLRKTACREDDEEVVSTAGSPLVEAVQHSSISTSDRVGPQGALPAQTPPTHS